MTERDPLTGAEFAARWRRRGATRAPLERGARRGDLIRIRRGTYLPASEWAALDGRSRHLDVVHAMREQVASDPVFSHASAAALLGIAMVDPWPRRPHLTTPAGTGRRTNRSTVWHVGDVEPAELARTAGILHTGPTRTVVDLAASGSPDQGVVAVDWLLCESSDPEAGRAAIRDLVGRRRPFPGVRKVDAALSIATGRSESPLESVSLARVAEWGLPAPQQQTVFRMPEGTFRVDFFWPDAGIIGEADGREKYGDAQALWDEKRREDALRRAVPRFVRWGWTDVRTGRLRQLLTDAGLPRARPAIRR